MSVKKSVIINQPVSQETMALWGRLIKYASATHRIGNIVNRELNLKTKIIRTACLFLFFSCFLFYDGFAPGISQ